MTDIVYKVMSWLYAIVAVSILSLWSIMMVVFLGADTLRDLKIKMDKCTIITLVAVPSLLTFLVCRIVMVVFPDRTGGGSDRRSKTARSPRPRRRNTGNMIRWIATADDGSPQGSLVLLLLSATWLLEVVQVMASLILLTGIAVVWKSELTAQDFNQGNGTLNDTGTQTAVQRMDIDPVELKQNLTTSLNEFKSSTGIDLVYFFNSMSGKGLMMVVLGIWGLLIGLGGYIIAQAVGALKTILTSPKEAWVGRRDEADTLQDKKTSEVASEVI